MVTQVMYSCHLNYTTASIPISSYGIAFTHFITSHIHVQNLHIYIIMSVDSGQ